jgi:hypothetical protein
MKLTNYQKIIDNTPPEIKEEIRKMLDDLDKDWISVHDDLPDYDERVLWYSEDGNMYVDALDKDGIVGGEAIEGYGFPKTTHWMKLPQGPT